MAESSFQNQLPHGKRQAEEINPDPIPMIVEQAAAPSYINPRMIKRKMTPEERRKKRFMTPSRPIILLDSWNVRGFKASAAVMADKAGLEERIALTEKDPVFGVLNIRDIVKRTKRNLKRYAQPTSLDAWKLRETCPDHVPVSVEKDARSDIPEIDVKKYQVHGEMPLGEFFEYILLGIGLFGSKKPVFVHFKNTKPSTGALMSAIDEENKEEDGFLHLTYSGEERVFESNEEQECS